MDLFDKSKLIGNIIDRDEIIKEIELSNNSDFHFFIVFNNIFTIESQFAKQKPIELLGTNDTPIKQVKKFYSYWNHFKSTKDFQLLFNSNDLNLDEIQYLSKTEMTKELIRINDITKLAQELDPRLKRFEMEKNKNVNNHGINNIIIQDYNDLNKKNEDITSDTCSITSYKSSEDITKSFKNKLERDKLRKAASKARNIFRKLLRISASIGLLYDNSLSYNNENNNLQKLLEEFIEKVCWKIPFEEMKYFNKAMDAGSIKNTSLFIIPGYEELKKRIISLEINIPNIPEGNYNSIVTQPQPQQPIFYLNSKPTNTKNTNAKEFVRPTRLHRMLVIEKDIPITSTISNSIATTTNNSRGGNMSAIRALRNHHNNINININNNNNNNNAIINSEHSANSNSNPHILDINFKLKPNEILNNTIAPPIASPRNTGSFFRNYQPHHQPSISKRIDLFESSKNNDSITIINDSNNSDNSNIKSSTISLSKPSSNCQFPNLSHNSSKETEKKFIVSNVSSSTNDNNLKQYPLSKKNILIHNQPPPPLLPPFESKLSLISPDKNSNFQLLSISNPISADKGALIREQLLNELEETLKKQEEDHLCIICLEMKREYAVLPCGHLLYCEKCIKICTPKQCPICRISCNGSLRIIMS